MNQELKNSVAELGAVFSEWLGQLSDKQRANVTTARRAGYVVITMTADGTTMVTKGLAGS